MDPIVEADLAVYYDGEDDDNKEGWFVDRTKEPVMVMPCMFDGCFHSVIAMVADATKGKGGCVAVHVVDGDFPASLALPDEMFDDESLHDAGVEAVLRFMDMAHEAKAGLLSDDGEERIQ